MKVFIVLFKGEYDGHEFLKNYELFDTREKVDEYIEEYFQESFKEGNPDKRTLINRKDFNLNIDKFFF